MGNLCVLGTVVTYMYLVMSCFGESGTCLDFFKAGTCVDLGESATYGCATEMAFKTNVAISPFPDMFRWEMSPRFVVRRVFLHPRVASDGTDDPYVSELTQSAYQPTPSHKRCTRTYQMLVGQVA